MKKKEHGGREKDKKGEKCKLSLKRGKVKERSIGKKKRIGLEKV